MATDKEKNKEKKEKKNNKTPVSSSVWKKKKGEKEIMLRPSQEWKAEPATIQRVQEIARRMSEGESRMRLENWMMENWEIGDRQARAYYSAAARYLIPDDEEDYKKGLIQANLNRLEDIVERTMTADDYKNAIQAIKEINRVLGAGEKNVVEVATDGERTAFRISFGGE